MITSQNENVVAQHLDEFGKLTLYPLRPMIGAEEEIKKMRRQQFLKLLNKIKSWDTDKKLRFLDILTDLVSTPSFSIDNYMKWAEKIEEKIDELDEFEELKTLRDLEKLIDINQLRRIINISLQNLKVDLNYFMDEIYKNIEKTDSSEKIEEFLVLGSMIQHIVDLIEFDHEKNLKLITIYLLRVGAYLMGKIDLDSLQLDLMKLSHKIPKKYVGDDDNVINVIKL